MGIKFGQRPTIRDMAKIVDDRLGATTGASKGSKPPTGPKISPKIRKSEIGATVKWKF